MEDKLLSKVLVLDTHQEHRRAIHDLCASQSLVCVTASRSRLMTVLRSNVDLGAILCAEDYAGSTEETVMLAQQIREARPELPIVVRRSTSADFDGLPEGSSQVYCAAYSLAVPDSLRAFTEAYIFSLEYPNALVRGIGEITEEVLRSQFPGLTVRMDAPYIVRDRIIYGELFTLIPLDSNWCRGYMQIQAEEAPILDWLTAHNTVDAYGESAASFRYVNSLLGETTNLIWGAFKNRYIGDAAGFTGTRVQVPIIVNHKHRYISFGTDNPQLTFRYTLHDPSTGTDILLQERFVFNLSWAPEDFAEIVQEAAELQSAGEIDFF